jgi:glycosyltransferase involved in cell wall biosynthesis
MPKAISKVSVVIPVYRSEESLRILVERLLIVFEKMQQAVEIVLVDDASPDNSWTVLKQLKAEHGKILKIARLLRNRGQHNAILCGLSLTTGEVMVTMDDDLQNPPEEIPKLLEAIEEGYDLVIAAYDSKKHPAVRNVGGLLIDRTIRRIFGLPDGFQLTSFRATRRTVVDAVLQMSGVFPYITCMLLSNASNHKNAQVRHEPRLFGKSNYHLKQSFYLAANLILSYSSYPLYLVGSLCLIAFMFSILIGARAIFMVLAYGAAVPGWASTVVIVSFFNGLILLCLSIFGLYLLRLHQQITRTRVSYTVSELHD